MFLRHQINIISQTEQLLFPVYHSAQREKRKCFYLSLSLDTLSCVKENLRPPNHLTYEISVTA